MTTAEPRPDPRCWEALKVLREKDGHSLTSLAKATTYSRQYLSLLERGLRQPSPAVIKQLAKALNVPKSMLEQPRTTEHRGDAA
jgi:transcriptional regulator with XRE-family HTH domain